MSEAVPSEVAAVDDLLEGRHRPGLHRLAVDTPAAELAGWFGAAGWRVIALELGADTDKRALLAAFASGGGFPASFGSNWDALQDALRDLSWAPAEGYVVVLDGWVRFASARPDDAEVLAAVLEAAASWWTEAGTPFHVLLRG